MAGLELPPIPSTPAELRLTRSVLSVTRSCTKMSVVPLVSLATKFVAREPKAT